METLASPRVQSQEASSTPSGQLYTFQLTIDESNTGFDGHFPDFPILPGVVQLHWVMKLAEEFGISPNVQNIDRLKFTHPIFPNRNTQLSIEHDQSSSTLIFKYISDNTVCSSGKVVLLN